MDRTNYLNGLPFMINNSYSTVSLVLRLLKQILIEKSNIAKIFLPLIQSSFILQLHFTFFVITWLHKTWRLIKKSLVIFDLFSFIFWIWHLHISNKVQSLCKINFDNWVGVFLHKLVSSFFFTMLLQNIRSFEKPIYQINVMRK